MVLAMNITTPLPMPGVSSFAAPTREPPANLDAEMALLGAILASNNNYDKVADFLLPEHFADPAHQKIYAATKRVIEGGGTADARTLRHVLSQEETLEELGGVQYLGELTANALTIIDPLHYGRLVHDLYLRRALIGIGEDVVNDAFRPDNELDAAEQIEAAEQGLFTLAATGDGKGDFQAFSQTLKETLKMVEAAYQREGRLTGVTSGFVDLDRLLGGLQKSDLLILAARPAMGKTALATNIAFNAAAAASSERDEQGNMVHRTSHNVAIFSLEMSAEQLALRILGEQSEVPSDQIRRGQIDQQQFERVFTASQRLNNLTLFIDDTPAISVANMRTRARRLLRTHGHLDLIVVDYLQLMQGSAGSRSDNRVQEISEITRGLKTVAKELNVPVIALSQLSRQVEQREDKRPQLSDLRESGSIEQDADVVMFIYREEYYLGRKEPDPGTEEHEKWQMDMDRVHNIAEVIIAKQRHGPTDRVKLYFDGAFTRFRDYVSDGTEDNGMY
jgi:replicative DNA helicase